MEGIPRTSSVDRQLQPTDFSAKSLDDLLAHCIDEALFDLVGSRAREAIYDHLERNHSLSRAEVPRHLNVFLVLLEQTFGAGSRTIGKAIIKRLYEKLEWTFEIEPDYEFMDHLEVVRARIAKSLIERAKGGSKNAVH